MSRILVAIAALIELAAAAGMAGDFGSIHVGLVALGLFVYFVAALVGTAPAK